MNRQVFLDTVQAYIKTDPEAAAYVAEHVQIGRVRPALTGIG